MREIKFRAWTYWEHAISGIKYKMLYSGDITEKGKGRALDFPFEVDDKFVFNIMQYTGLKDKNGREIYEGDILSYKHIKYTDCSKEEIEDIEKEVLIGLITYRPLASIIKPYSENVMCLGYDNINKECLVIDLESEELEVVGNIYENPDLLK